MEDTEYDYSHKLTLLGEAGVGKTNLILRFVDNKFEPSSKPTIGVDTKYKIITYEGRKVRIQLWDTAGQERFRATSAQSIRGVSGVVLVYDISKRETFDRIEKYVSLIADNAARDVRVLLIGNKMDLLENRNVTAEEGRKFADAHGYFFVETSALTNEGNCVEKAFDMLLKETVKDVIEREEKMEREALERERGSSILIKPPKKAAEKKCC